MRWYQHLRWPRKLPVFPLKLTCSLFLLLFGLVLRPMSVLRWKQFPGIPGTAFWVVLTLFAIGVLKSSLPLILIFVCIQFCNYGCSHLWEIGFSANSSCANGSAFCGVRGWLTCGITSTIDVCLRPTIMYWALSFSTLFSLTSSPVLGSIEFHEQRCIQ